jgi:hypothetical protein
MFIKIGKIGVGVAALGAVVCGVYLRFIRPWQLRWGATDEEVARAMPSDDVVKSPTFNATRGVTVQARPEEIWPWLVQIGVTRAGWYSYDLFDNLGKPSAERIIPELQHVAVGDVIPMSPDGKQGFHLVLGTLSTRGKPDAPDHACAHALPLDLTDDPLRPARGIHRHHHDA